MRHESIAEILLLGTGASTGIPVIGCGCPVCTSSDPKNTRLRPSALIKIGGKSLLIDSGPDFRFQALTHKINTLDGLLLTHSHFDHVAGLDELRIYYLLQKRNLPVLVSQTTLEDLKKRYDYLFQQKSWGSSLSAQLDFHVFEEKRGECEFLGIPIQYVTYSQGGMEVNGYRFGRLAYISDICLYPETIFEDLRGVEILVLDALREKPSEMHLSIDEAIDFSRKVGAKKTYFTHIGHELDHAYEKKLPEEIFLAYDGLSLEVTL
ncbi:MAG: Phosphoribosyl 1,2-cyclic phosphodiesterase [Chlamydiae bacterium]|nr:Phosphoribosyl 1,2-cyclic phosphodiesterase [Chlamydiota bacterium]